MAATVNNSVSGAQRPMELEKDENKSDITLEASGDGPKDAPASASPATGAREAPKEALERSTIKTVLLMLALCMAVFLAALDTTIITTALPTISEYFNSASGFSWIGASYLLGAASSTPIWAKISDIFGRKPILLLANVVFFVGSLVAALANSIGMLIAARAVQGIGGGGLISLVSISIGDLFSMRVRGMYYGVVGGVWAASALGPLLGGVFSQKVSWRWCFYINIPFQAIAFIIIMLYFKIHKPKTPLIPGLLAIDWIGCACIVGGVLMLLFGLEFGGQSHPWKSAIVICLIIFGVVSLALFALNEWRLAKYPIIPLHIFKYRSNIAVLGTNFCHGFVFIGGSFYLPLYFQAVLGLSPIMSGVYLLANVLSLSLLSMFSGFFIRKTGRFRPMIWFGLFWMAVGYGTFIDLGVNPGLAKIIIYQAIAGVGTGPNFQAPLIALQSKIPPRDIAAAVATFQLTRNVATAMSVVIGAVVFQNSLKSRLDILTASLGEDGARRLSGFNAATSAQFVSALPEQQRQVARQVFADSMREMWIMYAVLAVVGLIVSLFITKQTLDKDHTETKTGLAEEEAKRIEREERRRSKRESKQLGKSGGDRRSSSVISPQSPRSPVVPQGPLGSTKEEV